MPSYLTFGEFCDWTDRILRAVSDIAFAFKHTTRASEIEVDEMNLPAIGVLGLHRLRVAIEVDDYDRQRVFEQEERWKACSSAAESGDMNASELAEATGGLVAASVHEAIFDLGQMVLRECDQSNYRASLANPTEEWGTFCEALSNGDASMIADFDLTKMSDLIDEERKQFHGYDRLKQVSKRGSTATVDADFVYGYLNSALDDIDRIGLAVVTSTDNPGTEEDLDAINNALVALENVYQRSMVHGDEVLAFLDKHRADYVLTFRTLGLDAAKMSQFSGETLGASAHATTWEIIRILLAAWATCADVADKTAPSEYFQPREMRLQVWSDFMESLKVEGFRGYGLYTQPIGDMLQQEVEAMRKKEQPEVELRMPTVDRENVERIIHRRCRSITEDIRRHIVMPSKMNIYERCLRFERIVNELDLWRELHLEVFANDEDGGKYPQQIIEFIVSEGEKLSAIMLHHQTPYYEKFAEIISRVHSWEHDDIDDLIGPLCDLRGYSIRIINKWINRQQNLNDKEDRTLPSTPVAEQPQLQERSKGADIAGDVEITSIARTDQQIEKELESLLAECPDLDEKTAKKKLRCGGERLHRITAWETHQTKKRLSRRKAAPLSDRERELADLVTEHVQDRCQEERRSVVRVAEV